MELWKFHLGVSPQIRMGQRAADPIAQPCLVKKRDTDKYARLCLKTYYSCSARLSLKFPSLMQHRESDTTRFHLRTTRIAAWLPRPLTMHHSRSAVLPHVAFSNQTSRSPVLGDTDPSITGIPLAGLGSLGLSVGEIHQLQTRS